MNEKSLLKLERKIIIAAICDTDFLNIADKIIDIQAIQSKDARLILTWVFEYYHKYNRAPGKLIQEIYEKKLDFGNIDIDQAEVIEDILESLSQEAEDYDRDDIEFLTDQLIEYTEQCKLKNLNENIENLIESGNIQDVQKLIKEYTPVEIQKSNAVQPLKTDDQLNQVFAESKKPLIIYPGCLGQILNPHMVRQGFVVFLAQNKAGKSFVLMDAGIRAAMQGKKVLFCQAGDMSQIQMERRIAIYITQNSDQEKYCGTLYIPILDCIYNQLGTCDINQIEEAPFESENIEFLKEKATFDDYVQAIRDFPEYLPCRKCQKSSKYFSNFKGTIWYKKRGKITPLTKAKFLNIQKQQLKKFYTFFNALKNIRISTYSSESLTISKLNSEIDFLSETEGFVPDVIIGDYLDLFGADMDTLHLSIRDQENKKWQRARKLSQDRDILFLSASQTDAEGFKKKLLDKSNFSEDRRKLDHVTGMIGINMNRGEKIKGIMRMNEIVSRETEGTGIVTVLHRFQIGRPILGSYF